VDRLPPLALSWVPEFQCPVGLGEHLVEFGRGGVSRRTRTPGSTRHGTGGGLSRRARTPGST
jgi:hypothetical protein